MFEVAVIGAGRIGVVHAGNAALHRDLTLSAVVDPDSAAASRLAEATGARVAAFDDVLADPDIAGVIIASPTASHLAQATAAIASGKAVLLEKPLDLDLDRARAAAPGLSDPRLLVGFNRRFDPRFADLERLLRSGDLGALESLHITSHDPAAPSPAYARASGGLFKDMTIHDFDIARWLLAEEATTVFAAAARLVEPDSDDDAIGDCAKTVLQTPSGRLCTISNSRRSGYGYDQRIEAFCVRGLARVGNVAKSGVETWTEAGPSAAPWQDFFLDRYEEAYRVELDHFADVIAERAAPQVTYADGLAALVLAEAAALSARTGKAVTVRGSEIPSVC
jgi:myo-inositol 2-dehydrogenase/D-chiro-inositol 1-dehydrogenase